MEQSEQTQNKGKYFRVHFTQYTVAFVWKKCYQFYNQKLLFKQSCRIVFMQTIEIYIKRQIN